MPATPLERDEEGRFIKGLKRLGCLHRKLNGAGNRDWPDQLIVGPWGYVGFFEFKRRGKDAEVTQDIKIGILRAMKQYVYLVDDADVALRQVEIDLHHRRMQWM